jgi:excisionase family DNA binding protein
MPDELLTLQQVADDLQMSLIWVKRQIGEGGELPSVKFGNKVRVRRSDLDRFIRAHLRKTAKART